MAAHEDRVTKSRTVPGRVIDRRISWRLSPAALTVLLSDGMIWKATQ